MSPAIQPPRSPSTAGVARHYDELDAFYRELWGEHLHHGYWTTGTESPAEAAHALTRLIARRAGIAPGDPVCDVGCGYGAVAHTFATEHGARVTGLTTSRRQWTIARERAVRSTAADMPHAPARTSERRGSASARRRAGARSTPAERPRFLLRDWLENDLAPASFDAVVAIESLSHMADIPRALDEARRVLRPGGRLVVCAWLATEAPRRWQRRHLLAPICEQGRLTGLAGEREYRAWLGDAGFSRIRFEDATDRVRRTWRVAAGRTARALVRPRSWRYLLDGRNTERRFAATVLRMLIAYRTGCMRYGIFSARRPSAAHPLTEADASCPRRRRSRKPASTRS